MNSYTEVVVYWKQLQLVQSTLEQLAYLRIFFRYLYIMNYPVRDKLSVGEDTRGNDFEAKRL